MKKNLTIIIAVLFFLAITQKSYAAFPVVAKSNKQTVSVLTITKNHKLFMERNVPKFFSQKYYMYAPDHDAKNVKPDKTYWQAIVSMVFALCGLDILFYTGIIFGIGAIIFGILGIDKNKHIYTGMALAGIILGCIEILLGLLLI